MWRVHETDFCSFKKRMVLCSFSSLEVREAATALGFFFLEIEIRWRFLKPFSADCMFCFVWFYFCFFFLFGGGGGGVATKAPKSRVCDWGMFSLFRGIMPDQEGPMIFPNFWKKDFFYENEEFVFSTITKMTIFRFSPLLLRRLKVLKIVQF